MLRIITAHRQEPLLAHLAGALGPASAGDPLAPDLIVCERGTDRWLWTFLAEAHGIAANLRFEPPAGFLWRLLRLYVPDAPADTRFDRAPLAWRIARLLPRLLREPAFAALAAYLADGDARKLHQLADRIAGVFNDYLVYRPDMILAWEQDRPVTPHDDERWQMALWRAITAEAGTLHRAGLLQRFLAGGPPPRPAGLPARAAIFGIPALPPVYVQALEQLGEHIDIDLYVLNPGREFWGDLGDPRRLQRLDDGSIDGSDVANPLLAAWGQPVRHFISELYGHQAELVEPVDDLPPPRHLLARLQHDIHAVTQTPATLADGDDSLRITSAWSTMREVEILHDVLLDRFQRDATLRPRDVLVMIPDIERYAPCVEAVFGAADGERFIPWSITDLPRRGAHPLVAAVEQLLRLPDSRFAASEVIGLLETPAVARRFRLDGDALATVRDALRAARLHGDLDAASRAARGLPADPLHTWQFALQRLFLGIAMQPQPAPVLGVLPEPAFEGQASAIAGRLQTFIDTLAQWQQRLSRPQTPEQWVASLHRVIDECFDADDDEQAVLDDVLKAARTFLDETAAGGFEDALAPAVFRDDFLARLAAPASRGQLRTGGVVFCGMVPMRSLPHRVIAVLGMNNDAFPRQQRAPGFDLIDLAPRAGDRSRRHDDRHLFLETLLSARDALYLSYTGRNPQDNGLREPSVLVRELLDQVVATHGGEAARRQVEQALVVEHPLQPFSRRYFTADGTLFTHDRDWLHPARHAAAGVRSAPAFCRHPLPAPANPETDIALDRLARFFENPARAFLRERLGISLHDRDDLFDDDEPFTVDGLRLHALRTEVLSARLAGACPDALRARLLARGDLPQAAFGPLAWNAIARGVEPFVEALAGRLADARAVEVDVTVHTAAGPRRVHGRLSPVTPTDGQVIFQVSALHAKHVLAAWVRHLALLAAADDGIAGQTLLVHRGDAKKGQPVAMQAFGPVADARAELARLVEWFEAGLRQPLPLLPACAQAWVHARDEDTARRHATQAWEGDRFTDRPGERDDPAVRIAFGDDEPPFDDAFVALAHAVFTPLRAALLPTRAAAGGPGGPEGSSGSDDA